MDISTGFIQTTPSPQNVVDLFDGEWSTTMSADVGAVARPGHADLFRDGRITWANEVLGPMRDLDILELGPLEGAHSWMLELSRLLEMFVYQRTYGYVARTV